MKLAFKLSNEQKNPKLVHLGDEEFDQLVADLNRIKAEVQQEMEQAENPDENILRSSGNFGLGDSGSALRRSNPLRRSVQSGLLEKSIIGLNSLYEGLVNLQSELVVAIPQGVASAENLANFCINSEPTIDQIRHKMALRTGIRASFDFAWLASLLVSSRPFHDLTRNNPFLTESQVDDILSIVTMYFFFHMCPIHK